MDTPATSPVINPMEDHVGYVLRRASSLVMTTLAERLAEVGLRIVESSVLVLIETNPGIFQSEISRALGMQRANVVPLITGLEQKMLVRRSSVRGRQIGLSTTPDGKRIAKRIAAIMQANDAHLFGSLDSEAQTQLRQTLKDIAAGSMGPLDP